MITTSVGLGSMYRKWHLHRKDGSDRALTARKMNIGKVITVEEIYVKSGVHAARTDVVGG